MTGSWGFWKKRKKMKSKVALCHLLLWEPSHSIFNKSTLRRYYYYPHLLGEETEVDRHRREQTCLYKEHTHVRAHMHADGEVTCETINLTSPQICLPTCRLTESRHPTAEGLGGTPAQRRIPTDRAGTFSTEAC